MVLQLSDREASILLGATLMHWGVPFRSAAKRELAIQQQAIVDEASEKLIALRESYLRLQLQEVQGVPLSAHEIALLIDVVEDCLAECGNDATELSLQLKTSQRQEVEALVRRMRLSIQAVAPETGPKQPV
jgi:hypothetical protein